MKHHPQNDIEPPENTTSKTRYAVISSLLLGLSLATIGVLILLVFNFDARFLFLMVVFALSIVFGLIAAILWKTKPIIPILLAGLGLTILSFTYQPYGPESKIVGTECSIIRECVRPVRGGGFPVQYIVDNPGITARDVLGLEDEFRAWSFIANFSFYVCLIELARMVIGSFKLREKQKPGAG
jgi:hypothetical protein